jgi:hypothetical protein
VSKCGGGKMHINWCSAAVLRAITLHSPRFNPLRNAEQSFPYDRKRQALVLVNS